MSFTATPIPKPTITYAVLVGRIVEHFRKQAKMHQETMANAIGVSQSAYSRLEQGQSGMSVTQLWMIAVQLKTTPAALLHHTEQYANQLRAQGVEITSDKAESPAGGVLIALGILAALIAAAS